MFLQLPIVPVTHVKDRKLAHTAEFCAKIFNIQFLQIRRPSIYCALGRHWSVHGPWTFGASHIQSIGSTSPSAILSSRFLQRHCHFGTGRSRPKIEIRDSGVHAAAGTCSTQRAFAGYVFAVHFGCYFMHFHSCNQSICHVQDVGQVSLVGAPHTTAAKSRRFNGKRSCLFGGMKIAIEPTISPSQTISFALATAKAALMHAKAIAVRTVTKWTFWFRFILHPFANVSFVNQADHWWCEWRHVGFKLASFRLEINAVSPAIQVCTPGYRNTWTGFERVRQTKRGHADVVLHIAVSAQKLLLFI